MDALLADADRLGVVVERCPWRLALSGPARRVLDFYELCVAVRRWASMPEPYEVPFARRWVARHVGLHEQTVKRAIAELRRPASALGTVGPLAFAYEMRPQRERDHARGTSVFVPGWLVDVEELAAAGAVVAGGPEGGEEVAEDLAVSGAVADDGPEALEGGDGLGAAEAAAGGGVAVGQHGVDYKPGVGSVEDDGIPF
jgi:hypothetical protein